MPSYIVTNLTQNRVIPPEPFAVSFNKRESKTLEATSAQVESAEVRRAIDAGIISVRQITKIRLGPIVMDGPGSGAQLALFTLPGGLEPLYYTLYSGDTAGATDFPEGDRIGASIVTASFAAGSFFLLNQTWGAVTVLVEMVFEDPAGDLIEEYTQADVSLF